MKTINRSPVTAHMDMKRKCKVYDVDKKEVIGEFESTNDAAEYLGISNGHVVMVIKHKSKNKTNKLGLTITIR